MRLRMSRGLRAHSAARDKQPTEPTPMTALSDVSTRRVQDLIQTVYASALNATARSLFLRDLCTLMRVDASHRHIIHTGRAVVDLCHSDPTLIARHLQGYESKKELSPEPQDHQSLWTTTRQFIPHTDLIRQQFFDEWLTDPQSADQGALIVMEQHGEQNYQFGIFHRAQGAHFDALRQDIYDVLIPHCEAVARLMQVTQRLEFERHAIIAALDYAPFAVFILNDKGEPLECNSRAQDLLSDANGIGWERRRGFSVALDQDTHRIQKAIFRARNITSGLTRKPARFLTAARPDQFPPLEILAWPLLPSDTLQPVPNAFTAVFVRDPRLIIDNDTRHMLCQLYKLTDAEACVAADLMHGLNAADIGQHLGIQESTVQRHIRSLLYRTDTERLPQLLHTLQAGLAPYMISSTHTPEPTS
jgi:DNA-binding CsgD family transcriptional regulator/PAS domain-containing protein